MKYLIINSDQVFFLTLSWLEADHRGPAFHHFSIIYLSYFAARISHRRKGATAARLLYRRAAREG